MPSLFLSDVELGKKDDDLNKPGAGGSGGGVGRSGFLRRLAAEATQQRPALHVHPRRLLKRLLLVFGLGLAVYVFVHNLPSDMPVRDHRRPVYSPPGQRPQAQKAQQREQLPMAHAPPPPPQHPAGKASPPPPPPSELPATYDGPLRYLRLAASLGAVGHTHGGALVNKNVLFAAADVQSMAALLPLACQMGAHQRNYVHFAVMGRSELSVEELQQINGIDASCRILFHDARPHLASISTDLRLQSSVEVAMTHIQLHIHPQVIIVDGTVAEEAFLQDGMQVYTQGTQTPLLALPRQGAQQLGWIAELDSVSLANWSKISVDILIHAAPGASGSLIRLLKSLAAADYGGGLVPHLTIELPPVVDPPTAAFLKTFAWPPLRSGGRAGQHHQPVAYRQQLALRHRIPKRGISEEESAVRFLESFWPADPAHAHVLVLSPQAELAPEYLHYLKFTLLKYRYANPALGMTWDERLFGISLTLPSVGLDGTTPFVPPRAGAGAGAGAGKKTAAASSSSSGDDPTPFLWQAPNSNALLVLGEHWVELHQFVTQLLASPQHVRAAAATAATAATAAIPKAVSKQFPAWLELALQLCRARGFWTLYPSASTAGALATVHHELYQRPEEYGGDDGEGKVADDNDNDDGGDQIQGGPTRLVDTLRAQQSTVRGGDSGDDDLPPSPLLPPLANLPVLAWEGAAVGAAAVAEQVQAYANEFRRTVGGCSEGMLSVLLPETLFCE